MNKIVCLIALKGNFGNWKGFGRETTKKQMRMIITSKRKAVLGI